MYRTNEAPVKITYALSCEEVTEILKKHVLRNHVPHYVNDDPVRWHVSTELINAADLSSTDSLFILKYENSAE